MIRPETNPFREAICLDGLWRLRAETSDLRPDWAAGFDGGHRIAVPGSWNEQLAEAGLLNHTGAVWYQTDVFVPARAAARRVILHFGSADYSAEVFWNGRPVGRSGVLMLPFEVDVTDFTEPGKTARLVVRVEATLPETGPMQRVSREDYLKEGRYKDEYYPAVRFDFFPFGGLNRSVHLCLLPERAVRIGRLLTDFDPATGVASITLDADADGAPLRVQLGERPPLSLTGDTPLQIEGLPPWSPADPTLHDLAIEALDEAGAVYDRVVRRIGFRRMEVVGQSLHLNGAPVVLKGFGKHEDAPVSGRGVNRPCLVKDFGLLNWIGANSVRTSHYPYDAAFLDLADEQGVLVIPEVFSVNLDFRKVGEADLRAHKDAVDALFARDGWRASVIAWSLSNEPGYLGEAVYGEASAPYWADLFAHARAGDPTRPLTVANVQYAGETDPAMSHSDFISVNRYYGWYHEPGQIDRAAEALRALFDRLSEAHAKPVFVSEFGADAVAGLHATTDQMWTEEYQADLIAAYWREIVRHPAVVGGHVWNFADFRTAQHGRRVVMNRKGVFTRERDPKRAAFVLKELWSAGRSDPDADGEDRP